jgi:hypothetical protein
MEAPVHPLITRDPVSGGELLVTRLECPSSGIVIEGRFRLGWLGRLTPDQIAFVGLLTINRGNLQKVAADIGVSYNTARNRMDDIAAALGAPLPSESTPPPPTPSEKSAILEQLAAGQLTFDEALQRIKG